MTRSKPTDCFTRKKGCFAKRLRSDCELPEGDWLLPWEHITSCRSYPEWQLRTNRWHITMPQFPALAYQWGIFNSSAASLLRKRRLVFFQKKNRHFWRLFFQRLFDNVRVIFCCCLALFYFVASAFDQHGDEAFHGCAPSRSYMYFA